MFENKKKNKSDTIIVRVTKQQKDIIKLIADSKEMNVSELILSLLEEEFKKVTK